MIAQGLISSGGVLTAVNPSSGRGLVGFHQITDGTSNTLMVSECSNFIYNATYTKRDQTVNTVHGFLMGTSWPRAVEEQGGNWSRLFNCTTIRYPPNSVGTAYPGCGANDGQNNGIYSAHPGGVQGLFGDGNVRFISDTIDMYNLRLLATRDDGKPVQMP